MKVVAFIPVKLNNERIPGKNVNEIAPGVPLISCAQKTLLGISRIDEVYVYCSDEAVKAYLLSGVRLMERDPKYNSADADVNDMYYCFTQMVEADIYVLQHATAPFLRRDSIEKGIEAVASGDYDSALSGQLLREFVWMDDKPFNFNLKKIPRTQDLNPMLVETTGLYIFSREAMLRCHSRTGDRPFLVEVSKLEAVDIDYPLDFEMAKALYRYFQKEQD